MDVKQAVLQRRSIRAYLPRPVPQDVLKDILETSLWSPSATNAQAWFLAVVSGKAKAELCQALVEAAKFDLRGHPDIPNPMLPPECLDRRRVLGYKVYESKGIAREDKPKRIWWAEENLRFFGAPTAIIVHTPASLSPYILADMVIISMSIMLLATEKGLGTCPMISSGAYPEVLRERLGIPDDHLVPLTLALGYPDMTDPVNNFPRDREPLDEVVRFIG